ncbi:MAG: oligosaccharide flippase family protein [Bacteroidales bacterium]|nr:oligosaccharide flippase family protein [Bacteroidales bacterium]
MSFRKNLFKNIIVLGGYSYTSQFISFLATIILSRLLVPEEYGFVALITVFTGFIMMFSDAGLSYIIVRSDYNELFHRMIHYLSFIIGAILFILVVALAYPIALFYENTDLILPTMIMALNFMIRSLTIAPNGILSKKLRFNSLGSLELMGSTLEVALMIVLAFLNFSYWALILPSLIGNTLRVILYQKRTGLKFRFLKRKYVVVGFRKSKSIIGNLTGFNLINYWARNSDNLIIGKYYGADSLGIYNRAYRLLTMVLAIMTGLFGKVLYPSLKDLQSKGGDVNKEYLNLLGIISLINFPVAMLFIFFSEPLVRILWSETWIKVAELLPYIGILILTQTLNSTTGNIFILYNREKTMLRISIPINIMLIAAIVLGALLSYVNVLRFYTLGFIVINLPVVLYYGYKVSFGFDWKEILKFWIPKILLSVLLFFTVWLDYLWLMIGFSGIYLVHLLVLQKEDIASVYGFILKKIKKSKN